MAVTGVALGPQGMEHLTDLLIKKKSDFENEPHGVVFNAGVVLSDRLPVKSCGGEGKL